MEEHRVRVPHVEMDAMARPRGLSPQLFGIQHFSRQHRMRNALTPTTRGADLTAQTTWATTKIRRNGKNVVPSARLG